MDVELLEVLEVKNLHVHNININELLPNIPLAYKANSTHYIMHGADIVFCGLIQGVRAFAHNFKSHNTEYMSN